MTTATLVQTDSNFRIPPPDQFGPIEIARQKEALDETLDAKKRVARCRSP